MKYIRELDSVRAIAVLLVMISHWVTIRNPFVNKVLHYFGPIGVDMFFVLSGFLITWILFENYRKVEAGRLTRGAVLKSFYMRRTLRIFPVYYLVIVVLLLVSDMSGTRISTTYPWYLTYMSNVHFFLDGQFDGILSHLWSLAVEEQFYLIWPGLVLLAGRKHLPLLIQGFIAVGVISQLLLHYDPMGSVLTFTCFDAFGLGALLAWQLVFNPDKLGSFYRKSRLAAWIALPLFIAGLLQQYWPVMPLARTLISVMTLFLITYIVYYKREGTPLSFNFFWTNSVLVFLGKISYGLYLYHNLVPYFTNKALLHFFDQTAENIFPYKLGYIFMIGVNGVLTITISWASWRLVEKPILGLKKYFEYDSAAAKTPAASA